VAIKAGQILHDASGFTIDRIQTGGVSNVNIPLETIYELGNFQTVAQVRDIPDLSFDLESLDVSTEIEALLTGRDETVLVAGGGVNLDLSSSLPIDIVSPFKSTNTTFTATRGVAVPYLVLENATYRFGVRANSTEQFTFRGDSIYYTPGAPFWEQKGITSGTNQTYTFTQGPAIEYVEGGDSIYALSVCVKNVNTGVYKRLFIGTDYTNTSSGITVLANQASAGYTTIHMTYATSNTITYSQSGNNPQGRVVHQGTSVKPAAVRGKDIDVFVTDPTAATPSYSQWSSIQSIEINRRVTLEADEELGNSHYVTQDYNVPTVSGNIVIKPVDPAELFSKINSLANVSSSKVSGPYSSTGTPIKIKINDPDTGSVLKTFVVPDARFSPPAIQGRANQKLTVTLPWQSDSGVLQIYKGSF
jgi:hypothetical protein